jgi:hypothetical protein
VRQETWIKSSILILIREKEVMKTRNLPPRSTHARNNYMLQVLGNKALILQYFMLRIALLIRLLPARARLLRILALHLSLLPHNSHLKKTGFWVQQSVVGPPQSAINLFSGRNRLWWNFEYWWTDMASFRVKHRLNQVYLWATYS